MKHRNLPLDEWHPFFRDYSRIHGGALVTVNVGSAGDGYRDEVVDQPFRGISRDGDEIFVHIGGRPGKRAHLERRMQRVDAVDVLQTEEGADAGLDIASMDGTRTAIRFRSPILPELLD